MPRDLLVNELEREVPCLRSTGQVRGGSRAPLQFHVSLAGTGFAQLNLPLDTVVARDTGVPRLEARAALLPQHDSSFFDYPKG